MNDQQRAAMQMALEALEFGHDYSNGRYFLLPQKAVPVITALREALAQPQVSDYDREFWGDGQPQENTARCGGCNKTAEDGWALYCVECWEKAQPQDNLNCKSVQARLATSWGYVKAEPAVKESLTTQKQEPVAYWDEKSGEVCRAGWLKFHSRECDKDRFTTPLYAAPVEQAEQEPVCCVADLDSLQRGFVLDRGYSLHDALYAAPVEPVKQEPVSYVYVFDGGHTEFEELSVALPKGKHKLYTAPVRTKDLTDDEIAEAYVKGGLDFIDSVRAVIAADREKNK